MQDVTAKEAGKFASGFKCSVLVGEEANDNVGKQSFLPHRSVQGLYRQRQRQTLDFQQQQPTQPPHIKRGAWHSPARESGFEGWGDGGVGKVLAR